MALILSLLLWASSASAATAQPTLSSALDSYINVFYLAEDKLRDFDHELDRAAFTGRAGFIAHSRNYRDLISLRIMLESRAHAISEAFSSRSDEHGTFLAHLKNLDPAERLAASDLVKSLHNPTRELPTFYATLEEELAAHRSARALVEERIAVAKLASGLLEEMRTGAAELDFGGRRAPPGPILPSPGADGNINGSQFPVNTWALTYDDGPSATHTPLLLANLEEHKKKATFLWLVECLERFPGFPAKAAALGMHLGNHSWTHPNLTKVNQATLVKEITGSTEKQTQLYGAKPRFFRLPYGAGLEAKNPRQLIADNGMIHVFWNVDSLDWKDKNPQSIFERVKKLMAIEKRGIILMHDIHPQTVEASKLLMKYSASLDQGPAPLRWATLPEIVDEHNQLFEISYLKNPIEPRPPQKRAAVFPLDRKKNIR